MQAALDLSSSAREEEQQPQNERLPQVDLSSTKCERTSLSTSKLKCSDRPAVQVQVDAERSSCRSVCEPRGSELCLSGVRSLSVHALNRRRLANGYGCGRLKDDQSSRKKLCNDTFLASSLSHDFSSLLLTDRQHTSTTRLQERCRQARHLLPRHTETDIVTQYNSKFRRISLNKKPPASMHPHKNRTSFYSFPNLVFAYFLLVSLLSPSFALTTSSATTSPNLKLWSLASLETVDTGTERETSIHQVPIPDSTAIIGRLFQFQIPSSAFSGEVSSYKVCCSVVM